MNDCLRARGLAACELLALLALLALVAGCNNRHGPSVNVRPSFVVGATSQYYDGTSDDLLTAGSTRNGLASSYPPSLSVPPTAEELRRLAIYTSYHSLVDTSTAGGYGSLYGPNVSPDGSVTIADGEISGTEYTAYDDDGSGRQNVTMVVQIPDSFDVQAPCILAAASPGSRGVYGAISEAEWGLKRGCAVALTDKGTGAGPHDLQADTVPLIDGTRLTEAAAAGLTGASAPQFSAGLSAAELAGFDAATPDRFAFKHAHSGRNPEKDWGRFVLDSIQFAIWAINDLKGPVQFDGSHSIVVTRQTTRILVTGLGTGGAAAIAAAEEDSQDLIDGVAVAEPAVQMPSGAGVTVQRGSTTYATAALPPFDFLTWAGLYQACASQSAQVASAPGLDPSLSVKAANRCASLHAKGLLVSGTPAAQADEALQKLHDYGWEPESDEGHAALVALEVAPALAVTQANALAQARVSDNLCGYSYAATAADGTLTPADTPTINAMYGAGNGAPPTDMPPPAIFVLPHPQVQLVNNLNPGGPLRDLFSQSPSTQLADLDLDGAMCLRNLLTGTDATSKALQAGQDATRRTGQLNGKPVIIVHGRADAVVPVNHSSRAYAALAHGLAGSSADLSYVEVLNAQHFDAYIGQTATLPGYDTRFVPLHLYLLRALDALWAHVTSQAALPPSQVVRTVPRGGTPGQAPALAAANVPPIASAPAAGDTITYSGSTIAVPD